MRNLVGFVLCVTTLFVSDCQTYSGIPLDSCTLSCNPRTSHQIQNHIVSPIEETFRRLRYRGPKGFAGPKGEPGSPGESCDCADYAELKADVDLLKQAFEELKTKAFGGQETTPTPYLTSPTPDFTTPTTASTTHSYSFTTPPQAQSLGYTWFSNNHWYKLHRRSVVYKTAKQTCADEGGRLASTGLRDPSVKDDILREVALPNGSDTMIGLTDLKGQDYWVWSDGVESNSNNTIWNTGEPNNIGTERCSQMYYRNWRVNNLACTHPLYFLCEIPPSD